MKDPPWTVGVSAGYLTNSFAVFQLAAIRHEVSLNSDFDPEVFLTDANFDAAAQIADIEDMINRGVDGIIYWPVDGQAILPALERAEEAGIVTINAGDTFVKEAGLTVSVFEDHYALGVKVMTELAEALGGAGKIVLILPYEGIFVTTVHEQAVRDVIELEYPDIEILDIQNGDYNRAKSKTIGENWLQQYPEIDGVFLSAGQMGAGVVEAFQEAGRLGEVIFSPGDEYNGWLKMQANIPELRSGGVVTEDPVPLGRLPVQTLAQLLGGEEVTRGVQIVSRYFDQEESAQLADQDAPDDWWFNDLPDEFLP